MAAFLGMMAVWLGSSGDQAVASPESLAADIQNVDREMTSPLQLAGKVASTLAFAEEGRLVHQLRLYLNLESPKSRDLRVSLLSPSGTMVLIVDGSSSAAVTAKGIEGWFGADSLQSAGSFAAFAGEPVAGPWQLLIDSKVPGQLVQWKLSIETTTNAGQANLATSSEYNGGKSGCDCNVSRPAGRGAALPLLALLSLVLLPLGIRRR